MENSLLQYFKAQSDEESAKNLYNYAGVNLELKNIKCRLAEINSQPDPIEKLSFECRDATTEEGAKANREALYKIAFYVVVGRLLSDNSDPDFEVVEDSNGN